MNAQTVENKSKYSDETIFCVNYLKEKGCISPECIDEVCKLINDFGCVDFKLVKIEHSFFTQLAEKLRSLWPAGDKEIVNRDGTVSHYAWRDSVDNLSRRLIHLWEVRHLKEYSLDECLSVARRYLQQFESNARYMKTLKYFILKQKEIKNDGVRTRYLADSIFADMLEGREVFDEQDSWLAAFENGETSIEQGELI